jgi:hypothetical protein
LLFIFSNPNPVIGYKSDFLFEQEANQFLNLLYCSPPKNKARKNLNFDFFLLLHVQITGITMMSSFYQSIMIIKVENTTNHSTKSIY